jgi:hypothetical protein
MELPFHLKALPPEALDVIRFFGTLDTSIAYSEQIIEGVGLTDRTFGKIIRRLVTKGYLQMDGDQAYRLSDQGQTAVEELAEYDAAEPAAKPERSSAAVQKLARRLVLVTPGKLVADRPLNLYVGFHAADDDQALDEPADVVARISLLNAEPTRPQEVSFQLGNKPEHRTFQVTPGRFKCLRIRVQVFQLGPNPDDITVAGGMYVELDVLPAPDPAASAFTAYGTEIVLTKTTE